CLLSLTLVFQLNAAVIQAISGGFAGSLTTFSTVAVSAAQQHMQGTGGAWKLWILQVGLSIAACLFGVVMSLWLITQGLLFDTKQHYRKETGLTGQPH